MEHPYAAFTDIPHLGAGVRGLEMTRQVDLEEWMAELRLDSVIIPAMADTGMPVGLTFAGRAYDDTALPGLAAAFEATGERRTEPSRTPRIQ